MAMASVSWVMPLNAPCDIAAVEKRFRISADRLNLIQRNRLAPRRKIQQIAQGGGGSVLDQLGVTLVSF